MLMWQDVMFLIGSLISIITLAPTLRDGNSRVPLATALPSATLGLVYATTFISLDMTFSAVGSLVGGVMWSLIGLFRSPHRFNPRFVSGKPVTTVAPSVRRFKMFGSLLKSVWERVGGSAFKRRKTT